MIGALHKNLSPLASARYPGVLEGLKTSLVVAWRLDDLTDATGRGNTLTNVNTVTFTGSGGKPGGYANLASASSQCLTRAHNSDVNLSQASSGGTGWTITVWGYLTTKPAANQCIIAKGDVSGASGSLLLNRTNSTDRWDVYFRKGDNSGFTSIAPAGTPNTGQWYFLAIGYDPVADKGWLQVDCGTRFYSSALLGISDPGTQALQIGRRAGSSELLNGQVDSVNIWQRNLTTYEIAAIYNGGLGIDPI